MKKHILRLAVMACVLCFTQCVWLDDTYEDTPSGNLKALWEIIDQRYCFLEYKAQEYGLDWDGVYQKYSRRIVDDMSEEALFEVLGDMLSELRDGHVNLYSVRDVSRYWSWYQDYPINYSEDLVNNYLGKDFRIASGMYYKILDDNIGYMRYASFSDVISESGLDAIFAHFLLCNGLIIDVRSNGGGSLEYESQLVSRFTNESVLVGYVSHKTGPGHEQFSEPEERMVIPADEYYRWQKPVVVLTNRGCFSATNAFVNDMSCLPKVCIIGDRTGGGSGIPASSELPNGWSVRFSSAPMFTKDMKHIEFGIEPDIKVDLDPVMAAQGKDSMIEAARAYLNSLLD